MVTNQTYVFMVRCKCPGPLGVARVEVCWAKDPEAAKFFSEIQSVQCWTTACWNCRRFFRIEGLRAKVGRQECGSKCMASKGPSCECKCRGQNHGRSYAA